MLTGKEFAEKIDVSVVTLNRMVKKGEIIPEIINGKRMYNENDINKFKKKSKTDEFKQYLKDFYGYDPYTFIEEYKNNSTPIKLICNTCKHEIEVSPNNIKNNIRDGKPPMCKYCSKERTSIKNTKTKENYIKEIKDEYELIGDYIKSDIKTFHKCLKCGFEWEVSPLNILNSIRKENHICPNCNKLVRDNRPYEEKLKEINPNIINIEDYKGRKKPIKHLCLICNHEWECTPDSRLSGNGCPNCSHRVSQSKAEKEIIEFLNNYQINIEVKNRTILKGKEIDIFIPDKNIGIELDGNYWHSEKYKGKKYHLEKTELAEKNNIRLIHIFDDEWISKKEITKSKILNILGFSKDLEKIYARKCYIKEVPTNIKNDFLNKNHIQGEDRSNIKLGLYYNERLVSVMTFSKPRISMGRGGKKNNYDYELSRFATDINCRVLGGFSKLFKYFKTNYEWKRIISYADRRWSQGNVYEINGWNFLHNSHPNYWYVDKNLKIRYHRFGFRKQVLKEKFPEIYDPNLTEFQIMDKTKYFRIWDCGNITYEYINE